MDTVPMDFARTFVTELLGQPNDADDPDELWWLSEGLLKSRIGKPINGWSVTVQDGKITLLWDDLIAPAMLTKMYSIVGWAVTHDVAIYTPFRIIIDRKVNLTDSRDEQP